MSHECENCGQECYCDWDDTGGFEQPADCVHFLSKVHCDMHDEWDDEYDWLADEPATVVEGANEKPLQVEGEGRGEG